MSMNTIYGNAGLIEQPLGTLAERLKPQEQEFLNNIKRTTPFISFVRQSPNLALFLTVVLGIALGAGLRSLL